MSSSPSTKPYKSRLLNFLNRQYINFNSQVGLKFRQFSYLVSIGVKTLIYPFYLIFDQTQKLTGNSNDSQQNQEKFLQSNHDFFCANLSLPNSDQLIIDVAKIMNVHQTIKQLNPSQYQSIACDIWDHKIVFVTSNNEIKDILSPQQQRELAVIIREIRGNYWEQNRLKRIEEKINNNQFSLFFIANQLQEIKTQLNQLQSTDLAVKEKSINSLDSALSKPEVINDQNHSPKLLLFFDQTIAKLENWHIFPTSKTKQKGKISTQKSKEEKFKEQINTNLSTTANIKNQKEENLSIFWLIQSAVEHFFGNHKRNHSLPENSDDQLFKQSSYLDLPSDKYSNNKQLQSGKIKQLNQQIKDLIEQYQQKTQELIPVIENQGEKLLNQGLNQVITTQKKLRYYLDHHDNPFQIQALIWAAIDYFFQTENKQNLRKLSFIDTQELIIADDDIETNWLSWQDLYGEKKDDSETEIESTTNYDHDLPLKQEKVLSKTKELNKDISIGKKVNEKMNEEEIEAKVIEIKYEKHLLEIILEKLDQIILWLEELLLKIWQWLNSLISRKKQV